MLCTHALLLRTLENLELLNPMGRHDFMVQLAIETGGYFKVPEPDNSWDSQQFEIMAERVYASGSSETEAIRNWARSARAEVAATLELDRATAILDGRDQTTSDHAIRAACDLIIHAARTPYEVGRARQVLASMSAAA